MPSVSYRSVSLAQASFGEVSREIARRVNGRLAMLPDGRWTRMDVVFAGIVALLALSSTGFFTTAYSIWKSDPEYFSRRLIASMEDYRVDMIETGTVPSVAAQDDGALPVPAIHRERQPQPADYEIVMVFGQQAWLATKNELMRARVGSHLPGLGRVLSIDEATSSISTEAARLSMKAR